LDGITTANAGRKFMRLILIGLCALSVFTGLAPKVASQNITITVGPTTDDSYWVWNDDYQCWIWTGPEFQGDYLGHPYAYWHGRHEGGGDRDHRPSKGESNDAGRPVNNGDVEQSSATQRRSEVKQSAAEQPKSDVEKPKEQQTKPQVEQPKAEQPKSEAEKPQVEKPKGEEKAKTEKPKQEEKKDDSKPKGE
jgi:hypothetical protein